MKKFLHSPTMLRLTRMLVVVFGVALAATPLTAFAFFSGSTNATGMSLSAGTLVYTLDTSALAATLSTTTASAVSFTATNAGTIAPHYRLTAQSGACTSAFYDGLRVSVEQGTSTVYEGALDTLLATSSSSGLWRLAITPSSAIALPNDTCKINLALVAWQPQFASSTEGGFSDTKTIALTLTSVGYLGRTVDLNEILSYPDTASTSPSYASREFIELYNNAMTPISVAGWSISEMTGSGMEKMHSIVASGASGSEMEPYAGTSLTINPHQPMAFVFGSHAPLLNNDGDTVRLYDASGVLRDKFTYTSSTKGVSYAREPDGVGAWIDPRPTPNALNTSVSYRTPIGPLFEPRVPLTASSTFQEVVASSLRSFERAANENLSGKNAPSTTAASTSPAETLPNIMSVAATTTAAVASSTEGAIVQTSEATTIATSSIANKSVPLVVPPPVVPSAPSASSTPSVTVDTPKQKPLSSASKDSFPAPSGALPILPKDRALPVAGAATTVGASTTPSS